MKKNVKIYSMSSSIFLTCKSDPSFPAKARSRVVFPEVGGPKSNTILQEPFRVNYFKTIYSIVKFKF